MSWPSRACRAAVRMMQPLVPRDHDAFTILAYHLVGGGSDTPVDLPVAVFESQLTELQDTARVCSLDDALGLENAPADPRPTVVLTFDDGFDNFRTTAWPLLEKLNLPCTFYVPVGFVERTSRSPLTGADGLAPIEWTALRALASSPLLTVGSHSWSHRDLRRLGAAELRADLRRSRERLEDRTGHAAAHFCYPQAKRSRATDLAVRECYRSAVVAGGRSNVAGRLEPYRLWRVPIRRDMPVRLQQVVRSSVWLEEWAASHARALT